MCRNSMGIILSMLSGCLRIEDRRINEFNSFMEGLKEAFYKDYTNIVLETDHDWLWRHSSVEGAPGPQALIVQQLNQRRHDKNFRLEIRLTDPKDDALAAFSMEYGARKFK